MHVQFYQTDEPPYYGLRYSATTFEEAAFRLKDAIRRFKGFNKMKWYEMSVMQKKALIIDVWTELNLKHLFLDFVTQIRDIPDDKPCDGDGYIIIVIYMFDKSNFRETCEVTFRSLTYDKAGYVEHIIKTMAFKIAKQYFGIPNE